jgi:hypothetical protein
MAVRKEDKIMVDGEDEGDLRVRVVLLVVTMLFVGKILAFAAT